MRVVAGTMRGRKLVTPDGLHVRPTAERVRQATFNALEHRGVVRGARVVDLFAGSGALGIEALSRGAAHVTFVEQNNAALACIRENVTKLGLVEVTTIVRADVSRWLRGGVPAGATGPRSSSFGEGHRAGPTVDLLFADPPYTFDGWADLLVHAHGVLAFDDPDAVGVAVLETPSPIDPGPTWEILREQRYGGTVVTLAIPHGDEAMMPAVADASSVPQ